MLHCYFDDSGTHGDAPVAVWGGIAGATGYFIKLDHAWRKLLAEPLPGKPPIKAFSLADCFWSVGEFQDYKPAERDAVRFLFRQAIIDSGMKPFCYGIDVKAWQSLAIGKINSDYDVSAAAMAFAGCAEAARKISVMMNKMSPMACVFDKGQRKPELDFLISKADEAAVLEGVSVTYTYAAVADVTGLQAADTIATEHYWYGKALLDGDGKKDQISPHLLSFVQKVKTRAYYLFRPQLVQMKREITKAAKKNRQL